MPQNLKHDYKGPLPKIQKVTVKIVLSGKCQVYLVSTKLNETIIIIIAFFFLYNNHLSLIIFL